MYTITWISRRNKSNRLFDASGILAANTRYLIGLHVAGILWFGIVPLVLFNQSLKTILLGREMPTVLWTLSIFLLLVLTLVTGFRASRLIPARGQAYPILLKKFLPYYFLVRILFLCAYELFFRGFLLFDCMNWFGIYPAIAISTGLTVLIHVFISKKEMWACIPFGIILCSCCIAVKAVWPAIGVHLALSLAYEIPSVNHFLRPAIVNK